MNETGPEEHLPTGCDGHFDRDDQKRLQAGLYEVEDSSGRLTVVAAESSSLWPVGVAVVIQNDRIIGGGHRLGKHRVVEG